MVSLAELGEFAHGHGPQAAANLDAQLRSQGRSLARRPAIPAQSAWMTMEAIFAKISNKKAKRESIATSLQTAVREAWQTPKKFPASSSSAEDAGYEARSAELLSLSTFFQDASLQKILDSLLKIWMLRVTKDEAHTTGIGKRLRTLAQSSFGSLLVVKNLLRLVTANWPPVASDGDRAVKAARTA